MEKIQEITKGKAKSLFTTSSDDQLIMHFSDDTSAFDGKKMEALMGKGSVNNQFNAFILALTLLGTIGGGHFKSFNRCTTDAGISFGGSNFAKSSA